MKKIAISIFLLIIVIGGNAQRKTESIRKNDITARDALFALQHFIWRNDTINFFDYPTYFFSQDDITYHDIPVVTDYFARINKNDNYFTIPSWKLIDSLFVRETELVNSVVENLSDTIASQVADSLFNYVAKKDSGSLYVTPTYLSNKLLDYLLLSDLSGANIDESDSTTKYVTPTQLSCAVETSTSGNNVFSISLPYSTTVSGRIAAATEGVDYPTGWTLTAGSSLIDLQVAHGLNRRVANVNVCTVSGTTEQLLRPFAGAYSGWQTTDANTLLINALATTPLPLRIYLTLE